MKELSILYKYFAEYKVVLVYLLNRFCLFKYMLEKGITR